MATNYQPPRPQGDGRQHLETLIGRIDRFWDRVTEGRRLNELWSQFSTDARSSYRLYSKEVDSDRSAGIP
jgi:hypothetical protein